MGAARISIARLLVRDRSRVTKAACAGTTGRGSDTPNRKIAIDWNALHHFATAEDDHITLDLTRDQVRRRQNTRMDAPLS
jgi:hypothetical protein